MAAGHRNVKLLEAYTICMNMLFIVPVIMPYYKQQIGLSFQDFLIGEAVFAAVIVALEVPSGWLSDVWKRKNVLILSSIAWIAGSGALLMAENLATAILAQGILGVAVSLFSGTNSALLYDTLLLTHDEDNYTKLEGRRQGFGLYSVAGSSALGGFLYAFDPHIPLIGTMIFSVIALGCCFFMIEPPRHKSAIEHHPLADMLATMRYALRGHADIGFIILFAAVLFSSTKLIMWSQQPYYMALEIPEALFGILMAVGFTLGGLSSHSAHLLNDKISNIKAMTAGVIAAFTICILTSLSLGYHGIALLMVGGSCLYGLTFPRVCDAINKRVGSERRATILSTANLLRELFFIPLSLAIGWIFSMGGVQLSLNGVAVWLALGGLILGLWALQRRIKNT